MVNNQNQLLENKQMREEYISRVEVLEQVGELLLLPNTEFATTEQVASYFGVGVETIQSLIKDNREELLSNGFGIRKRKEILNVLKGQLEIVVPNRGMNLFPKRAILNVAMLLRDSEIAKEIRTRLLDIVQDVSEGKGNVIENIVNEISEEKQLMLDRVEAEMQGDYDKVCEINSKLFALKNKRIKELEDKVEDITTHSLTIMESKKVINRLMRLIATKDYGNMFGKAYSELYSKVNYQLNINVKARTGGKTMLDRFTESELFKVEEIVRTWANNRGIDLHKELSLAI